MERPFTYYLKNNRCYKDIATAKDTFKKVRISIIQLIFKDVRRYIEQSRAIIDNNMTYNILEIENIKKEEEGKAFTTVEYIDAYIKAEKYTEKTVDEKTERTVEYFLEKMQLTNRQKTVLKYRLQGVGARQISKELNCTPQNVTKISNTIKKKFMQAVNVDESNEFIASITERYKELTEEEEEEREKYKAIMQALKKVIAIAEESIEYKEFKNNTLKCIKPKLIDVKKARISRITKYRKQYAKATKLAVKNKLLQRQQNEFQKVRVMESKEKNINNTPYVIPQRLTKEYALKVFLKCIRQKIAIARKNGEEKNADKLNKLLSKAIDDSKK